jgi:hypothetical protein
MNLLTLIDQPIKRSNDQPMKADHVISNVTRPIDEPDIHSTEWQIHPRSSSRRASAQGFAQ